MLCKHLGMFIERHEVAGPGGTSVFGKDQLLLMAELILKNSK
jgi:hypothetical protein